MSVPIWKLLKRFIATRIMLRGKTLKTKCKYKQTAGNTTTTTILFRSNLHICIYIYCFYVWLMA